jgi:hypothetical protein
MGPVGYVREQIRPEALRFEDANASTRDGDTVDLLERPYLDLATVQVVQVVSQLRSASRAQQGPYGGEEAITLTRWCSYV